MPWSSPETWTALPLRSGPWHSSTPISISPPARPRLRSQGGGANAEPVQRRLTDYNLAQTEAALRKYMRGYFGAPLYDQSQLESLERELCVDEHQGCHLYYATGDDTHEKLKGYVAAQRRNALRQMELNRAAYEADATRHRTSIRRLTARNRNAKAATHPLQTVRTDSV